MDLISQQAALNLAKSRAGGSVALAKLLGITSQAISQWDRTPVRWVLRIEEETGVPRAQLRPDIYPPRKRNGI